MDPVQAVAAAEVCQCFSKTLGHKKKHPLPHESLRFNTGKWGRQCSYLIFN